MAKESSPAAQRRSHRRASAAEVALGGSDAVSPGLAHELVAQVEFIVAGAAHGGIKVKREVGSISMHTSASLGGAPGSRFFPHQSRRWVRMFIGLSGTRKTGA
jgi:hypothetical protein